VTRPDDHQHPEDESSEEPDTAFEKKLDASDSDYLLRAMRRYQKALSRRLAKTLAPLTSLFAKPIFSPSTLDAIRKNVLLSDQLQDTVKAFRQMGRPPDFVQPEFKPLPIPENPAYETNRRLAGLLDYVDRMEPLVVQSAELIGNVNDAAIKMLRDFGRSTRRAEIYSKIMITVAALSLLFTAVWSFFDGRRRSEETAQLVGTLRTQIDPLITGQDDQFERLVHAFETDSQRRSNEQQKAFSNLIDSLRSEFAQQAESTRQALTKALSDAAARAGEERPASPDLRRGNGASQATGTRRSLLALGHSLPLMARAAP
jgi:hypothetical protein